MIMSSLQTILIAKLLCDLLALVPTKAIDDTCLSTVVFDDEVVNILQNHFRSLWADIIVEICSIERLSQKSAIPDAQTTDNVLKYLFVGRCSECHNGNVGVFHSQSIKTLVLKK